MTDQKSDVEVVQNLKKTRRELGCEKGCGGSCGVSYYYIKYGLLTWIIWMIKNNCIKGKLTSSLEDFVDGDIQQIVWFMY